jgi:hypothetical protein
MSKSRLRELIQSVISAELSLYADRLDEDERTIMEQDAERRITQILARARKDERELAQRSGETTRLLQEIRRRYEPDGSEPIDSVEKDWGRLTGLIAQSESMTHYCLHNMMCLKEEMDKLRRLVDAGPGAVAISGDDTALLKETVRGRLFVQLCQASTALIDNETILDLAVLLDEAPGERQMEELIRLNDVAAQAIIARLDT